jgi:hypothetical protein
VADALAQYGFPSQKAMIRRALGLASASVPTTGSIRRQYRQASGDVAGFTKALVDLLKAQSVAPGGAYADSIAQERGVNEAAQARLGALGPEYAVSAGASGDTQLSHLLAGQASAGEYGARQPGIAASRGVLSQLGLTNAQSEALKQRREALRSAFVQAYDQVRSQALAEASFGLSAAQFQEGTREFNVSSSGRAGDAAAQASGQAEKAFFQARSQVFKEAERLFKGTKVTVPGSASGGPSSTKMERLPYAKAFDKLWTSVAPELMHLWGIPRSQIKRMIKRALVRAGYKAPVKQEFGATFAESPGAAGGL